MATLIQQPLPDEYTGVSPEEVDARIAAAKAALGARVVVLGHHYQRDEIIKHADFIGDSFKLSRLAADRREAEFIVFCGVHFMAESADILAADYQRVILPNLEAGCSMADMASREQVEACWEQLASAVGTATVPITYVNSAADLKAFCGERGGAVCTSSNALGVLKWAQTQGERILFFPDEHLGRNTAFKLGIPMERCAVWDPALPFGGNDREKLRQAQVILWKGFCAVHQRFTVDQIARARARYPGVRIIVHPECRLEVVQAADDDGSTEHIIKRVSEAPAGTVWGVGTEIHLVHRLAKNHPDKRVFCLDPIVSPCATMYRIHPKYLLWVLENLVRGKIVNEIVVPAHVVASARVALNRMLSIV